MEHSVPPGSDSSASTSECCVNSEQVAKLSQSPSSPSAGGNLPEFTQPPDSACSVSQCLPACSRPTGGRTGVVNRRPSPTEYAQAPDYFAKLRRPDGFPCPRSGGQKGRRMRMSPHRHSRGMVESCGYPHPCILPIGVWRTLRKQSPTDS